MYLNTLNQYLNNTSDFTSDKSDVLSLNLSYNISVPKISLLENGSSDILFDSNILNQSTSSPNSFSFLGNYITPNYIDSGLVNDYYLLKKYEDQYSKSSEDILNLWKTNKLPFRNSDINEWLETYLQIRPFIDNDPTGSKK